MIRKDNYKIFVSQKHMINLRVFNLVPETMSITLTSINNGEGNGTPLQYSCLENPMDGGAWWAAISGVMQSRTRLRRLSSSSSSINKKIIMVQILVYVVFSIWRYMK